MSVTVGDFFEAGKDQLSLELIAGAKGTKRQIAELAINRPGLALTGFFKYFASRRMQTFGLAENTFLQELPAEERLARLTQVFDSHVPCVVVTRKRKVIPELRELAEKHRVPVMRTPLITSHFINAATLLLESLAAPRMKVQGTMVEIHGVGVLIEGPPGVGKSETALTLIEKGFSLVADDVTQLRLAAKTVVVGSPMSVTRYHMEVRGLGIIHVPSLFGVSAVRDEKNLNLIITLADAKEHDALATNGHTPKTRDILGVEIPHITLPVVPGRDLANLAEVAALDLKLRMLGHDAAKELDEKLIIAMTHKATV